MTTSSLELKRLLAERFGSCRLVEEDQAARLHTGLPVLDEAGIARMSVTEVTSPPCLQGTTLLLYGLLHVCAQAGERTALVDGRDCFQPLALPRNATERLLWVRCRDAKEALHAADLVVRDGNFSLVMLLLALNPAAELRRIPSTAWHRLQMLLEKSGSTLFVFTPCPLVGNARLRISVEGGFPLERLHGRRADMLAELRADITRRRGNGRKGGAGR